MPQDFGNPVKLSPAPDLPGCARLRDEAAAMLRLAWSNPTNLGEDSEICRNASALLAKIKSHLTPISGAAADPHASTFVEALRLAWLAVWRARDYTSEGISKRSARHKWNNPFPISMALNDAALHDGVYWPHTHFPAFDQDGRPIPSPQKLDDLSNEKWAHYREPSFWEGCHYRRGSIVPPHNMPLDWAVFAQSVPSVSGGLTIRNGLIAAGGTIDFGHRPISDLSGTIVLQRMHLRSFESPDLSVLAGCRFEGGLVLEGTLARDSTMAGVSCGLGLRLLQLSCAGGFQIGSGVRRMDGSKLTVAGQFHIVCEHPLALSIEPGGAQLERLTAWHVNFSELTIPRTRIDHMLLFQSCSVPADADFSSLSVGGEAQFNVLTIRESETGFGFPSFQGSSFGNNVAFKDLNANRWVNFAGVHFERQLLLSGAQFHDGASFKGAVFDGNLLAMPSEELDKRPTFFGGEARFDAGKSHANFGMVFFRKVVFAGETSFEGRQFEAEAAFEQCDFQTPPIFHRVEFHPDTTFDHTKFTWPKQLKTKWWNRPFIARWYAWRGQRLDHDLRDDDKLLSKAVTRFRELSSRIRKAEDTELAYRFHTEELRARSLRFPGRRGSLPDAWAGAWYGWLGNFGSSFVRPLVLWVGLLLSSTLVYSSMAPDTADRSSAAFTLALAAQTRPFVFADHSFGKVEGYTADGAWKYLHVAPSQMLEGGPCEHEKAAKVTFSCLSNHLVTYHDFQFKVLATIQSILSIVLLFLAALGLRRKFQAT